MPSQLAFSSNTHERLGTHAVVVRRWKCACDGRGRKRRREKEVEKRSGRAGTRSCLRTDVDCDSKRVKGRGTGLPRLPTPNRKVGAQEGSVELVQPLTPPSTTLSTLFDPYRPLFVYTARQQRVAKSVSSTPAALFSFRPSVARFPISPHTSTSPARKDGTRRASSTHQAGREKEGQLVQRRTSSAPRVSSRRAANDLSRGPHRVSEPS